MPPSCAEASFLRLGSMVLTTDLLYHGDHVLCNYCPKNFPMTLPNGPIDHLDPDRGVYGISVAAELVGSAPQNLRLYEARGLITPVRSGGGTRRYSDSDLTRLLQIGQLLDDGLNLAGVAAVLALRAVNQTLQTELDNARHEPQPVRRRTK
jgi:MerR family transcriptional regulator/heat shock protein HspR